MNDHPLKKSTHRTEDNKLDQDVDIFFSCKNHSNIASVSQLPLKQFSHHNVHKIVHSYAILAVPWPIQAIQVIIRKLH